MIGDGIDLVAAESLERVCEVPVPALPRADEREPLLRVVELELTSSSL